MCRGTWKNIGQGNQEVREVAGVGSSQNAAVINLTFHMLLHWNHEIDATRPSTICVNFGCYVNVPVNSDFTAKMRLVGVAPHFGASKQASRAAFSSPQIFPELTSANFRIVVVGGNNVYGATRSNNNHCKSR